MKPNIDRMIDRLRKQPATIILTDEQVHRYTTLQECLDIIGLHTASISTAPHEMTDREREADCIYSEIQELVDRLIDEASSNE